MTNIFIFYVILAVICTICRVVGVVALKISSVAGEICRAKKLYSVSKNEGSKWLSLAPFFLPWAYDAFLTMRPATRKSGFRVKICLCDDGIVIRQQLSLPPLLYFPRSPEFMLPWESFREPHAVRVPLWQRVINWGWGPAVFVAVPVNEVELTLLMPLDKYEKIASFVREKGDSDVEAFSCTLGSDASSPEDEGIEEEVVNQNWMTRLELYSLCLGAFTGCMLGSYSYGQFGAVIGVLSGGIISVLITGIVCRALHLYCS